MPLTLEGAMERVRTGAGCSPFTGRKGWEAFRGGVFSGHPTKEKDKGPSFAMSRKRGRQHEDRERDDFLDRERFSSTREASMEI